MSIRVWILLGVSLLSELPMPAQPAARSSSTLSGEERENQKAQAEYYREQTEKLRRESSSWWKPILELLPAAAAWVAAFISVAALSINHRAGQQIHTDNQFYEALKRFGDKSSPAVRMGAAGLLGQMAQDTRYTTSVADQLTAGIAFENTQVVLDFIASGILSAAQKKREHTIAAMEKLCPRLERQMAQAYVDLLSAYGIQVSNALPQISGDEEPVKSDAEESAEQRAKQLTEIETADFQRITSRAFKNATTDSVEFLKSAGQGLKTEKGKIESSLRLSAMQFRTLVETFALIVPGGRPAVPSPAIFIHSKFGEEPYSALEPADGAKV